MIAHYSWQSRLKPNPNRALLRRAMCDAAQISGLDTDRPWEFRIWFLDDQAMADAHESCMNISGTTDVITFAYLEEPEALFPGDTGLELLICVDVAKREGDARADSSVADELMLYLVHGCLHAAGEDDLTPEAIPSMRRREQEVLAKLREKYDFHAIFPLQ